MNYYKLISEEPMFWSRMGWCVDYGEADMNGQRKPVYMEVDWNEYKQDIAGFFKTGCRVFTSNIHNGWIGVNSYDYTAMDQAIEAYCGISPEIFYMPRIRLDAPLEWCIANPGELSLTEDGSKNLDEIQKIFVQNVNLEAYNRMRSGGPYDKGVHLNSFSSGKWLQDASEALRRAIEHIENGKYARQIAGYHITFGMCGETCNWGIWSEPNFWGDFSTVNAKAFYDYCIRSYGSKEKAEAALGIGSLTYNNILPSTAKRCVQPQDIAAYFRDGEEQTIRYSKYLSECISNNICHFAGIVKRIVPYKPVGFFYGYLMSKYPAEAGHLCIQKLIDSPDVDFLSAPKSYYRSGAGESGGSQTVSMSVARKMIWLDELDNDTHITEKFQEVSNHPTNMEETRTIFWREAARNLAWNNQNFWWMDLYGGWFRDKEIMDEIGKLIQFIRHMRTKARCSISEILLLTDESTNFYQTCDPCMMGERVPGLVNEIWAELRLCGAPVDEYRLADLRDLDISRYKMIVFANAFTVDEEIRRIIADIPESTLCIWNYAAGIRKPEFGLLYVKELTGMAITTNEKDSAVSNGYGAKCTCPPIRILPEEGVTVLECYEDGTVKTARKKNSLLAAVPHLSAEEFHRLAKAQGCHLYTDAGCTIYADSRFVGVFSGKQAVSGLCFREEGLYTDILSGNKFTKENSVKIPAKSAMIFQIGEM